LWGATQTARTKPLCGLLDDYPAAQGPLQLLAGHPPLLGQSVLQDGDGGNVGHRLRDTGLPRTHARSSLAPEQDQHSDDVLAQPHRHGLAFTDKLGQTGARVGRR
jgi:hypothetical protein